MRFYGVTIAIHISRPEMDENPGETTKPNNIEITLASILERLEKLELKNVDTGVEKTEKSTNQSSAAEQTTSVSLPGAEPSLGATAAEPSNSTDAIDASDLQREYWTIKDSLSKIQLSSSLKLNEVALGINKKDKPVQKVLQRTSRVLETALKLCQLASTDPDLHQDSEVYKYFEQIYIVLQAGIQQNQQEFQSLLVQGQFNEDTARVFRILQQNKNCFPDSAVSQLELAAKISTMSVNQQQTQSQSHNNSQRGRNARGGFRGRYNNNNSRFQRGHVGQDVYRQFNSYNNVPPVQRNASEDV